MPLQPVKGMGQFPKLVPTSAYFTLILILLPSAWMVFFTPEAANVFLWY